MQFATSDVNADVYMTWKYLLSIHLRCNKLKPCPSGHSEQLIVCKLKNAGKAQPMHCLPLKNGAYGGHVARFASWGNVPQQQFIVFAFIFELNLLYEHKCVVGSNTVSVGQVLHCIEPKSKNAPEGHPIQVVPFQNGEFNGQVQRPVTVVGSTPMKFCA